MTNTDPEATGNTALSDNQDQGAEPSTYPGTGGSPRSVVERTTSII